MAGRVLHCPAETSKLVGELAAELPDAAGEVVPFPAEFVFLPPELVLLPPERVLLPPELVVLLAEHVVPPAEELVVLPAAELRHLVMDFGEVREAALEAGDDVQARDRVPVADDGAAGGTRLWRGLYVPEVEGGGGGVIVACRQIGRGGAFVKPGCRVQAVGAPQRGTGGRARSGDGGTLQRWRLRPCHRSVVDDGAGVGEDPRESRAARGDGVESASSSPRRDPHRS
nr:unnamed protein product [Digitaria exilis]